MVENAFDKAIEFSHLAAGERKWFSHFRKILAVSQKGKHCTTIWNRTWNYMYFFNIHS